MEFDVHKLEKMILALRKNNEKIDFTEEEISFMRNIFNIIIDSEDQESVIRYLAGINCMSISDVKFIRTTYYLYFADHDEKMVYNKKMRELKKESQKKGFIDFGMIISFLTLVSVIGITLALYIYNL